MVFIVSIDAMLFTLSKAVLLCILHHHGLLSQVLLVRVPMKERLIPRTSVSKMAVTWVENTGWYWLYVSSSSSKCQTHCNSSAPSYNVWMSKSPHSTRYFGIAYHHVQKTVQDTTKILPNPLINFEASKRTWKHGTYTPLQRLGFTYTRRISMNRKKIRKKNNNFKMV